MGKKLGCNYEEAIATYGEGYNPSKIEEQKEWKKSKRRNAMKKKKGRNKKRKARHILGKSSHTK